MRTVVKNRGVQKWGRWYSQAPEWEAGILETKKKVDRPHDEKRPPRTERPTHPPPTTQCTFHPPTDQTFTTYSSTAVQQYVLQYTWYAGSSQLVGSRGPCMTQETDGGSFIFRQYSVISGRERAAVHHPPTIHHPPTDRPSTAVQQCSST